MMRTISAVLLCLMLAASPAHAGEKEDALLAAVRKSDAAGVKALLAQGADANAKFRYDRSILSFACDRGNAEIVKLLLDAGAKPDAPDSYYRATPLDWAMQNNHVEVAKLLLERGAPGRGQGLAGSAQNGNVAMVKMLLELGGFKPEELSQAYGAANRAQDKEKKEEIVALLTKAGAKPPPKPEFKISAEDMPLYAGKFTSPTAGAPELNISVKDGKLGLATPQGQFTLGAFDKENFVLNEFDAVKLKFKFENGKTTGLTLTQGTFVAEYKKSEEKPQ